MKRKLSPLRSKSKRIRTSVKTSEELVDEILKWLTPRVLLQITNQNKTWHTKYSQDFGKTIFNPRICYSDKYWKRYWDNESFSRVLIEFSEHLIKECELNKSTKITLSFHEIKLVNIILTIRNKFLYSNISKVLKTEFGISKSELVSSLTEETRKYFCGIVVSDPMLDYKRLQHDFVIMITFELTGDLPRGEGEYPLDLNFDMLTLAPKVENPLDLNFDQLTLEHRGKKFEDFSKESLSDLFSTITL